MHGIKKAIRLTFDKSEPFPNFPTTITDNYKKFLTVRLTDEKCRAPNLISQLWKNHVLDTESYYGFCNTLLGMFVHCDLNEFSNGCTADEIKYTMDVMETRFNEKLEPRIWNVVSCSACKENKFSSDVQTCGSCKNTTICSDCRRGLNVVCPDCGKEIDFQINIRTLTGKIITIDGLKQSDTVMDLKRKIQNKEGVSPCQQKLLCDRVVMEHEKQLSEYGITDSSTIFLVLDLRGC